MENLLEVKHLEVTFAGDAGAGTVVDDLSYHVHAGETVCIVGESGCGKSVSSLALLGLLPRGGYVTGGEAWFDGQELLGMTEKERDRVRGNTLSMIFQDALSSLNPVLTVGRQLTESLRAHLALPKAEAVRRAVGLLTRVGLPDPADAMKKYPHTLSGGQRQRVMIAMALACAPKLLIADEPTTALDVTIQAQIMELLRTLQRENGMSLLLITHDIGLVARMADRVLVMYAGQLVEEADVNTLFTAPRHPYTQALLHSVPDIRGSARLASIRGSVPERYQQITGCRFASRCPYAAAACEAVQPLTELPGADGHRVRCSLAVSEARAAREQAAHTEQKPRTAGKQSADGRQAAPHGRGEHDHGA